MMRPAITGGLKMSEAASQPGPELCKLCGRAHPQYACVDGGKICRQCLDAARYERDRRQQA